MTMWRQLSIRIGVVWACPIRCPPYWGVFEGGTGQDDENVFFGDGESIQVNSPRPFGLKSNGKDKGKSKAKADPYGMTNKRTGDGK
jgi:hypothetical protein